MGDVEVQIRVNGTVRPATVAPRLTLADFLRERCGLTGTHLGCEHGVCGACTVLLDGATLETIKESHRESVATLTERIAKIEGIDQNEVAARLSSAMNVQQATYAVAGQTQKLSLLNYLA